MAFSKRTKLEAWTRDRGRCRGVKQNNYNCGVKIPSMSDAEFDHIHAQNISGPDSLDNCATLCKPCHKLKTNGTGATTYGSDKHEAAKVKRLRGDTGKREKHSGGWNSTFGNKHRKKKLDGSVVPR